MTAHHDEHENEYDLRAKSATLDTKALEACPCPDCGGYGAIYMRVAIEDGYREEAQPCQRCLGYGFFSSATPSRNDILEEAAAFKAGQAEAEARIADLLKDPAAVRVNYLRGGIACQNLINEALEEAARVAESAVDTTDDGIDAFDASQIIAAAIRALVKPDRPRNLSTNVAGGGDGSERYLDWNEP